MQQLSIGPNCDTRGTVLHELLHALGFGHEHVRPDRDTFVRINFHRIRTGMLGNNLNFLNTGNNTPSNWPIPRSKLYH